MANLEFVNPAKEADLSSATELGIEIDDVAEFDAMENIRCMVRTIGARTSCPTQFFEGEHSGRFLCRDRPPK